MSERILAVFPTARASALGNTGFGLGSSCPHCPPLWSRDSPPETRHCWSPFLPLSFQPGLPDWLGIQFQEVLFLKVSFRCPGALSRQSCLTYQGIVLCVSWKCQQQLWPDLSAAPSLRNLEPRQRRRFPSPVIYIKAVLCSSVMRPGVTG